MNTENQNHLDEKTILMAVIDKGDLAASHRQHLSLCLQCRKLIGKIEQDFANLGEAAQRLTPTPSRRPLLPPEKSRAPFFRLLSWQPALPAALTILIVAAVSIWFIQSDKIENVATTGNYIDIWEEEQLMLEMDLLAENALPGEYREIITDAEVDFEEAFLNFIAPIEADQPMSLDGIFSGGDLC